MRKETGKQKTGNRNGKKVPAITLSRIFNRLMGLKPKRRNPVFQFLFFILISLEAGPSIAKSPQSAFEQANQFYIEKNYEKSISILEDLVKTGNVSAELYYNLGNAYYKSGNYAAAILHYERAKKLKPSDPDIDFNLRLANLNTIDKIEPAPQVFYVKWWNDFVSRSSIETHAKNGLLFIWIAFFISLIYIFVNVSIIKRITFFVTFILLCCGIFSIYLSQKQLNDMYDNQTAIIVPTSVYVKGSPDDNSINLFMLHSGTKVTVIDELQSWKRIRIANGNEGWILSGSIEII
ncbi:MAG TPA: tetratricopeptide repeat protein [Bacteroidia bacterium]|nr:tetratricopeptide repeat protein [Bacteroidia bacterium]